MRSNALVWLPALAGLLTFAASPPAQSFDECSANAADVVRVEAKWDAANAAHDVAALRSVLFTSFSQINADASVTALPELLHRLAQSANHVLAHKVTGRRVRFEGDSATLTARYTEVGRSPRGYYRATIDIADIYRCSGDGWRGAVGFARVVKVVSGQSRPPPIDPTNK